MRQIIKLLAILFSLFHLYIATFGSIGTFEFRIIHFIGAGVLIYMLAAKKQTSGILRVFLPMLAITSVVLGFYLLWQIDAMQWRVSMPLTSDIVLSIIALIIVLDLTRRTIGWAMPIITLVLIGYGMFGQYIPGYFGHGGYSFERMAVQNFITTEGMFGTPIGIMAQLIFVFVLFGVALEVSGAGNYFLNLAKAIAGGLIGGPAKMAIIGSAMFGSMSGSAVANTVATGSLTIPLMKKMGYKPHVAAGIEASASTGGQMVPPIMGAAAFLISEYTGTPYLTVVLASILPAIAYYVAIYTFVHLEAKKEGLSGLPKSEVPPIWDTFKSGFYYFIPIIIIVVMFMLEYSVAFSAAMGTLVLFLIMLIQSKGKVKTLLEALEQGAISAVQISSATICAGVIVGVVALTGLGLKFSGSVIGLANEALFLAILLVALASFILGMGLPVVASYIILVVVAGPGLEQLGVPLLAAHLIVFWFSQLSNVTPPVALAAFAGAGVANANPMKTSFYAVRIAIALPIIPILFAYRPMLINVSPEPIWEILFNNFVVILGLIALVCAFEGVMRYQCSWWQRLVLLGCAVGLLIPSYVVNLIGGIVFALLYIIQLQKKRENVGGVNFKYGKIGE